MSQLYSGGMVWQTQPLNAPMNLFSEQFSCNDLYDMVWKQAFNIFVMCDEIVFNGRILYFAAMSPQWKKRLSITTFVSIMTGSIPLIYLFKSTIPMLTASVLDAREVINFCCTSNHRGIPVVQCVKAVLLSASLQSLSRSRPLPAPSPRYESG